MHLAALQVQCIPQWYLLCSADVDQSTLLFLLLLLLLLYLPQLLVLDEADEMLSMNFTEQIYNCYRYLPPDCQVRLGRGLC
jgi:hypothetical protein